MTYQETTEYLFNQLPVFQSIGAGAYKPGLDTARALAEAWDNPHKSFRTVHVAGTNGKGSTSHMIASVLAEAGYKVGLYTSPHIFDFRERIRVNGEKISEEAVVDFVQTYIDKDLALSPSFFELTTIMAFDYFRNQEVDIAVIEVGLGGRLDTTNIITPEVSVITNISIDHKAQLGETEVQIAGEKAGIVKQGVPVVIGEAQGDVRKVFEDKAAEVGAPIIFAEDNPYASAIVDDHYIFAVDHEAQPSSWCELQGEFQRKNVNTVLHAIHTLGITDLMAIRRGLMHVTKNTHLMGRWTPIHEHPTVICDTGHNIGAWKYLAPRLTKIAQKGALRMVIGFVNDKDVTSIFELLPHENVTYYFVTPSVKRGRPSSELLEIANRHGLIATAYDSVHAGLIQAMADSAPDDTIFVGGSNFVVADLHK